jgi:hypothetical protein
MDGQRYASGRGATMAIDERLIPWRCSRGAALLTACLLAGALSALPAAVRAAPRAVPASANACRVTNLATGITRGNLQRAVRETTAGGRLRVKGTCHGVTVIGKDLRMTGITTSASGPATLDGDDLGSVLTVRSGASVVLVALTITDGTAVEGGGIRDRGSLVLRDVIVRGNIAASPTTLPLPRGGGVLVEGRLTLKGSTAIRGNAAGYGGGGVHVDPGGILRMEDAATIRRNTAEWGAGVFLSGTLRMEDASSIARNSAGSAGGGVYINPDTLLDGVDCGGNVRENAPDDCALD